MKKIVGVFVGVGLIVLTIVGREWLTHQEVQSLEEQLRAQITQQIKNIHSMEKLQTFNSSNVVYERYLEPIVETANRLLLPSSRQIIVQDWRRNVHTQIDDLTMVRAQEIQEKTTADLKVIRANEKPGMARFNKVLEQSDALSAEVCKANMQQEVKDLRDYLQAQDESNVSHIRREGVTRIRRLQQKIRMMSTRELQDYLTSSSYRKEIEQPVMELILSLKEENLRKSTWNEFNRKLESVASKRARNRLLSRGPKGSAATAAASFSMDAVAQAQKKSVSELQRVMNPASSALAVESAENDASLPKEARELPSNEISNPSDGDLPY